MDKPTIGNFSRRNNSIKRAMFDLKRVNFAWLPFFAVQSVLYFVLITANRQTNDISFAFILICFCYVATNFILSPSRNKLFFCLAYYFTLVADFFLVLHLSTCQTEGLIAFSICQIFYAVYLSLANNQQKGNICANCSFVLLRILIVAIFIVLLAVFIPSQLNNLLFVVSIFYFSQLLCNFISFFFTKNILLIVGFLLFILCDFIIGLNILLEFFPAKQGSFLHSLIHYPRLEWIFYAPSQMAIALYSTKA